MTNIFYIIIPKAPNTGFLLSVENIWDNIPKPGIIKM